MHKALASGGREPPDSVPVADVAKDQGAHAPRSPRKKEGAFYTPAFVTRYIVAETLRPVLADRFERLRATHAADAGARTRGVLIDPSAYDTGALNKTQSAALVAFWEAWQEELTTVRVVDPSCGSGAFLIEAFDQLFAEYRTAAGRLAELRGPTLFDIDRTILTNNLYGVDLNAEAVEICRLSLWIKTAAPGKPLTSLDKNVVGGNSVVGAAGQTPLDLWRARFPDVFAAGGFDVVIGNPPYVRQEWIKKDKPYLEQHYRAYDGVADLYVYFYELGLTVLRPGGRLGFIVTNKWMKAGYGEPLRTLYGEAAWVESLVDVGHAKTFFPDADVFPCILIARRPTPDATPPAPRVCVIPRDQVRIDDLSRQIAEAGVAVPRDRFGPAAWNLEPPGVTALMEKLQRVGVPLKEFAGVSPLYGVKTGCNEAFVVDTATRERLISEHPSSAEILKRYLSGSDVDRWACEWAGRWMVFARRGIDIDQYPAIRRHLDRYQVQLEPRPKDWTGKEWPGRKPGSYQWYELQDTVDYWEQFEQPKIVYPDLSWRPSFALDRDSYFVNDTTFVLPSGDLWLLAVLNSPVMWYWLWRNVIHGKDETLRLKSIYLEQAPIPQSLDEPRTVVEVAVARLKSIGESRQTGTRAVLDWLRHEFGVEKASQKLQAVGGLTADEMIGEVQKARGRSKKLTVADVKRLKEAHAENVTPLARLAAEARGLEVRVSDLVNAAYGLTPADVALMWETAPPRT
ncbi:MAG TPA: N-6 DNA methylase, partial [Gemmataceae bacterium]|nr:N-6 DNA methylase [Gemmataceae bacterium]